MHTLKHLLAILISGILISHLHGQSDSSLILGKCDNDFGRSISILSDKSKIIVGSTDNYIEDGDEHILISRIDSLNNQLWSRVFYGESDDIIFDAVLLNNDIVFVGTTRMTINNIHTYRTVVFRLDKYGQMKWSYRYDNGIGYKAQITNDSNIIVTGRYYTLNGVESDRLFALSLDSEGNVNWNKTFYFGRDCCGEDIIVSNDNTIFITGYVGLGNGGNPYNRRPVLIKLDSQGNLIWKYYYLFNNNTNYYDLMHHPASLIQSDSDSNIYLLGTYTEPYNERVGHLLKINSQNGQIIWNRTYNLGYTEYFKQIVEHNHMLYLFGNYMSFDYSDTDYDMFLIKADRNGLPIDLYMYGDQNDNLFEEASESNNSFEVIGTTNNFFGDSISLTMSDIINFRLDSNCFNELQINSNIIVQFDSISSISLYSDFYMEDIEVENKQFSWEQKEINSILSSNDCEGMSIDSPLIDQDIKFFPNPVKNKMTVICSEPIHKIEIFNLLGQLKFSNQLNTNKQIIDLSHLMSGVYFISFFYQDSKIRSCKIIKE